MQANYLSIIGRSGFVANLFVAPGIFALYQFLYVPY